jgi:hypothetical protein
MKSAPLLLLLCSCAAPPPPRPDPPPPAPDPALLRSETAAVLAALDRDFPLHWGSVETTAAFRTLRREHVPFLRELADANGPRALTALRVLARLAPGEKFGDSARAILYVTAFEGELNFSRWGVVAPSGFLPGVYGSELLACGKAAVPFLRKLLSDRRRAPVPGSGSEETNRRQGDRVCDYAWVFLATILDRPMTYHADPGKRDLQIRELDLWLDRRR